MVRRLAIPVALVAALAAPHGAAAQGGNGLYEPFPDDIRKGHAVLFVEALGFGERASVTREQLESGRFLDPGAARGMGGASMRAGLGTGGSDGPPLVLQLTLLAGVVGVFALAGARRPGRRVATR